jgi:hypothetical protein
MGVCIYLAVVVFSPGTLGMVPKVLFLGGCMAFGLGVYFGLSVLLRIPEVTFLKGFLNRLRFGGTGRAG